MNVKKVFYIIFSSIIIMAFVIGGTIASSNTIGDTGPNDPSIEQPTPDNPPNVVIPPEEDTSPDEQPEVPVFSNGFKAIEYATNIILNGKGFIQRSTISCEGVVMGVAGVQFVKENVFRSGNQLFKEATATTNSIGKTFYRCMYSSDINSAMTYRYTDKLGKDDVPNWSGADQEEQTTMQKVMDTYDYYVSIPIALDVNKQNSRVIKFDKVSDKENYHIVVQYDVSKLPAIYGENAMREGGLSSINFHSIKLTYVINKATGYIVSYRKQENYKAKMGMIEANVTGDTKNTYPVMNKEFVVNKPTY